jgi:hypothetical protein
VGRFIGNLPKSSKLLGNKTKQDLGGKKKKESLLKDEKTTENKKPKPHLTKNHSSMKYERCLEGEASLLKTLCSSSSLL